MKYFLITVAALTLAGCGGASDTAADKVADSADIAVSDSKGAMAGNMTRAKYLDACSSSAQVTKEQCECTLEAYEEVGLKFSDLTDTDKVQKAMTSMTPAQMQKFAGCMK